MNALHTVASTQPDYGGPSRSVPFLCEALAEHGISVRLVTTVPESDADSGDAILPADPVEICPVEEKGWVSRALRAPVAFYRVLQDQVQNTPPDVIHDHGAWLPSNATAAITARRAGVPLVVSTRGMFMSSALQRSQWKKQIAWHAYQKHILGQAALLHVTSQDEQETLRRLGFNQPIALIPNGVRIPPKKDSGTPSSRERRALFLSRLHPIKGLPILLDAWAHVRPRNWVLDLVGPSEEDHRDELVKKIRRHGMGEAVRFSGAVSEEEKWDMYRRADLFILPSHSENFGIVVAEALAAGVPVITTTGTPWEELEERRCGWRVDPEVDSLSGALREAVQCPPGRLQEMGQRGRVLVEERYTWRRAAARLQASYRWILGDAARPDCVHVK